LTIIVIEVISAKSSVRLITAVASAISVLISAITAISALTLISVVVRAALITTISVTAAIARETEPASLVLAVAIAPTLAVPVIAAVVAAVVVTSVAVLTVSITTVSVVVVVVVVTSDGLGNLVDFVELVADFDVDVGSGASRSCNRCENDGVAHIESEVI